MLDILFGAFWGVILAMIGAAIFDAMTGDIRDSAPPFKPAAPDPEPDAFRDTLRSAPQAGDNDRRRRQ